MQVARKKGDKRPVLTRPSPQAVPSAQALASSPDPASSQASRSPFNELLSVNGEAIELASLIIDPDWYVEQYPDIGAAGVDPVQHFLNIGFSEGRNPNRFFDGAWYAQAYPDVAAHGENPFVHYVFYGAREGRKPRQDA